jgi:hypothetical protein
MFGSIIQTLGTGVSHSRTFSAGRGDGLQSAGRTECYRLHQNDIQADLPHIEMAPSAGSNALQTSLWHICLPADCMPTDCTISIQAISLPSILLEYGETDSSK